MALQKPRVQHSRGDANQAVVADAVFDFLGIFASQGITAAPPCQSLGCSRAVAVPPLTGGGGWGGNMIRWEGN